MEEGCWVLKSFNDLNINLPVEPGIYKVEFKADSYPNGELIGHKLSSGDVLFISDTDCVFKLGDRYKDFPATVSEICYAPKKWWQFWKPKKQIGCIIRWLGDDYYV